MRGSAGRRWLAVALVVAVALTGWVLAGARRKATPEAARVAGRNLLLGASARDAVAPALTDLSWQDLSATAAGTGTRTGLRRDVIDALARDPRAEARYLRGLLEIAEARPEEALAAFDSIPLDQIPVVHLYAPYRLHGALRPGRMNPYRAPLVAARRAGRLPPLIAARVAAAEGDFRATVKSYVTSDPAEWVRHDLVAFRALLLHAGFAPDTRTMLAAALRAGRVPVRIQADIEELLRLNGRHAPPDELRAGLRKLLTENPAARDAAIAAATEQLRVRRLFLARQYAQLVDDHRASDPTSLPDATLVVLLVSARQAGALDLGDLWAQELRRRHPEPEFERWLSTVKPDRS